MRISINDNYPDWTWSGDPNAPWNEPDDSELYEQAYKLAEKDAKENDGWWSEFIADKFNLETDDEIDAKVVECSNDESIINEYYEKYKDDYFEYVTNNDDEPDYDVR